MTKKITVVDINAEKSMSEIMDEVKIPNNNTVAFDIETEREIGYTTIEKPRPTKTRSRAKQTKQPPPPPEVEEEPENEVEEEQPAPQKPTPKRRAVKQEPPKEEEQEEEEEAHDEPIKQEPKAVKYITCEHCNVKLKEKTYKYSHKSVCRGLRPMTPPPKEQVEKPISPRPLTKTEIRQEKMIALARQAF